MKYYHFFIFPVLVLAIEVYGQDTVVAVSRNRYTQFDLGVGYLKTDLRSVNTALAGFGYNPLREDFASLSASGSFILNRFMLRTEVSFYLPNAASQANNITTRFYGNSVGFGFGYAVIRKPTFRVTPYVGLNSFVARLQMEDHNPVEDINGVLNTPHRTSILYFSNASLDVGVQIDKLIPLKNKKWDCPQNQKFMTLGVRMGYHYGPGKIQGSFEGYQRISDSPYYSLKGPYMKLVVGLGSKMRDLKWRK